MLSSSIKSTFNSFKLFKGFKALQCSSFLISIRRNHNESGGLSYYHNYGKYPLAYRTIGQELGRIASEYGDREAFVAVQEQKRLTYDQLRLEADRLAAGFRSLGLQKGDRVGLWAPNVISWPVVFYAAARAGLIFVALNPAYEAPEMEYCLQKVGVKALVTSESFRNKSYYDALLKILPELQTTSPGKLSSCNIPSLSHVIVDSEKNFPGVFRLSDVASMPSSEQVQEIAGLQDKIDPDSGCNIMFTSGTTGKPKAALLRHIGIVNNAIHLGDHLNVRGKRICTQVPFFHIYGVSSTIMLGLCHVATVVIPSITFNAEQSLRTIKEERCRVVNGTPTMHVDLVRIQREQRLDLDVDLALTGGALCPPQLMKYLKEDLGIKEVKNVYGTTENSSVSFGIHYSDENKELDIAGQLQYHLEAKVIDAEGNLVPFGTPGELCVRGYFTMLGYWEDEAKTKEVLGRDGWLRTGDQFILYPDGYGQVVGRLKDMINRGGENIFPKEVENILVTCPQIAEAYVVGVPDERLGEELCAFVRLRDGVQTLSLEEVKEFCHGKISYFKIPRYLRIVDDFPKTLSGKIQKFKLQEQFRLTNEDK
ncbi:medium-chain acyl-CoA ligase ACSF2, mitochondrial-like [Lutzomyia longipalpis]|uniref:medium-chain acyl-CoA ligase ACSF2, mitochondrial-like n=1 Tax=Lutzomyia longipalpis TaxID=7200 RepID=UPI002483B3EB|nr:medium-chain acyl-CoA ligase ACSF2, mitochondrial-like [Lutzomyia longipalpis]